jgi:hypothetical protein
MTGCVVLTITLGFIGWDRAEPASAAQPACLHGAGETADQAARRQAALGFTRHVNTMQAQGSSSSRTYAPLAQLGLRQPVPDGFAVKISTDGSSYSFSVIDETDGCRFGYFSNDSGIIYRGEVIR